MNINVILDDEHEKMLNELKKIRYTRNSSQIVREALRSMYDIFLGPAARAANNHPITHQRKKGHKK